MYICSRKKGESENKVQKIKTLRSGRGFTKKNLDCSIIVTYDSHTCIYSSANLDSLLSLLKFFGDNKVPIFWFFFLFFFLLMNHERLCFLNKVKRGWSFFFFCFPNSGNVVGGVCVCAGGPYGMYGIVHTLRSSKIEPKFELSLSWAKEP